MLQKNLPQKVPSRAAEHMEISNLRGKHPKNSKQSTISDHLFQCHCTVNFVDFNILAAVPNKFKLPLREVRRTIERGLLNCKLRVFLDLRVDLTTY